jgi:ribonucleoside-diphosphate reductase alpha chain
MDTTKEFYWLNDKSIKFLKRGYLKDGVEAKDRIRECADFAEIELEIPGFADKFFSYMAKGWYSLASPIWANYGLERGLPISCNGSYIPDTMDGILSKQSEVGMMTKHGAGTSAFFGDLRPRGGSISSGGSSSGPVHFMQLFNSTTNVVAQSNVRRGSFAAYMPIDHTDIEEFLQIKEEGNEIQDISIGVCISDAWMNDMLHGKNKSERNKKRDVWALLVKKRFESGYPYIFFTDTVNDAAPQVYKDKGLKIHASNLCSEICLHSSPVESFVCDLSSMNLLHYEEWKDTDAVEVLSYFLDAVMSDYIRKVEDIPYMKAAYNFAKNQRALGVGVLGWHSFLQSKMIPFESMEAKILNNQIFKLLQEKTQKATKEMAALYGEPELLKGYGIRNVTMMAIAPTTSSSFILGQVSPSIEPLNSNYFTKGLAKGKFTYKNPYLKKTLAKHDRDDKETWASILQRGGSVQHLDFLSQNEKDVFKTFGEITQKEIVIQAAARQKRIDQSQSLNVMIDFNVDPKDVSKLLIFGWEQKVKTFYYQRGTNPAQQLSRNILNCASCEG